MVRFGLLAVLGLLVAFVGWALYRHGLGRPREKPQQAQQRTIANPPSFVVIVGDDVGYGDLGCYGQKHITTPQIDRLAKDGIRLTNFYAGDPTGQATCWCLMTGRDMAAARGAGAARFVLQPQQPTIAAVLRAAGYRTGFVGTWTLGGDDSTNTPGQHGFDEWAVLPAAESDTAEFPVTLNKNSQTVKVADNADGKQRRYVTDVLLEEVKSFLRQHADGEPFALFVVLKLPRGSTALPALKAYAEEDWPESRKAYAARISEFDQAVGLVTAELEELRLANRTAILVTSASGPVAAEAEDLDFFQSTGGLRGKSGELYEAALRVPCIVRAPNQGFRGVQRDYAAAIWDFLPTLAEFSGAVQVPKQRDGVSIAGMLRGGIGGSRDMFYWDVRDGDQVGQAVRIGDWKVVRPVGKSRRQDCELYDLAKDPGEKRNVADKHPEIVAKFLK